MPKILLVEDDKLLAGTIVRALTSEDYTVEVSGDGLDACERLKQYLYDLLILDWDLPFRSGLEICEKYRGAGGKLPVLFLTGKADIQSKEAGFDAGADDYLTKPFELRELRARVKALLRRPAAIAQECYRAGPLELYVNQRKLLCRGETVSLSPKEFALMAKMMQTPGNVLPINDLLNSIWTADEEVGTDTLRTHIKNIRNKIDEPGKDSLISTVFGVGYKIDA